MVHLKIGQTNHERATCFSICMSCSVCLSQLALISYCHKVITIYLLEYNPQSNVEGIIKKICDTADGLGKKYSIIDYYII